MKAGDIVRFGQSFGLYKGDINGSGLRGKKALFLGERPLHRSDGVIINNFEVLVFGEELPRLCDGSMKRWLEVVSESR